MSPSSSPPTVLTVFHDGACPLCRREIALYRGLRARRPIDWADVSDPATVPPDGVDRTRLLARFHVRTADGVWLDGAAAFTALWAELPGWRWLARLARVPGMLALMGWSYDRFLRVRPWLQRRLGGGAVGCDAGAACRPQDRSSGS